MNVRELKTLLETQNDDNEVVFELVEGSSEADASYSIDEARYMNGMTILRSVD